MPPSATSYTAGIDAVTRDSNGFCTPLEGETIRIRLLDGTVLAAVTAENQGFVPPQTLASVDSETEVEFYCPGRIGTLRMFTARTPESAFSADVTLILDDAFAGTQTSEFAEVYLRDNTDSNIPLKYLGSQPKDSVRKYLFETSTPKDLDIFAVPRTSKFAYGTVKPEDSAFDSLASVGGLTLDYTRVTGFPTNSIAGRATAGMGALEPLTLPGIFTLSAGVIGLTSQSANKVLSGPTSGGAAVPTFRSLVAADIPSLDAAKITTGVIAAARLGTGSPSSANFLRGDGSWQTVSVSPAGSNTQVQFNNSGNFGASGNFTYDGKTLLVKSSGSSQTENLLEIVRYDASIGLKVARDSVCTFGADYDYTNGYHASEHIFKYANAGTYSGKGIKLHNIENGAIVRLHALSGNSLYVTDNSGVAAGMTLGTRVNPGDSTTFTASFGRWIISAGGFVVNNSAWAGFGQTESYSASLPQFVALYNSSNYAKITVGSNGATTFDAVGSAPKFIFSDCIEPASMADASAPNNSIYYSTTANKLVYKDSGGTVNNLY